MSDIDATIDNEEAYTVLAPAQSPSVTISTHQRPPEASATAGDAAADAVATDPAQPPSATSRTGPSMPTGHSSRGYKLDGKAVLVKHHHSPAPFLNTRA
jgi:hypothetical protein